MTFKGHFGGVPMAAGTKRANGRARLRVKIAPSKSRDSRTHFDEAFPVPVERIGPVLSAKSMTDDPSDHLTLRMSKNTRFGKRFSHGERYARDVSNRKHVGMARLQGMSVYRYPTIR